MYTTSPGLNSGTAGGREYGRSRPLDLEDGPYELVLDLELDFGVGWLSTPAIIARLPSAELVNEKSVDVLREADSALDTAAITSLEAITLRSHFNF